MNQKTTLTPASKVPHWLAPDDARKLLHSQIEEFVMNAACGAFDPDTDAPALAMKVTAGLGKTAAALHVIAEHAEALLTRGHPIGSACESSQANRPCDALKPSIDRLLTRNRAACFFVADGIAMHDCGECENHHRRKVHPCPKLRLVVIGADTRDFLRE